MPDDISDSLGLLGTTMAEKYAIESVVGEGGFAIVYKAMHVVWKRPVAVKVFKALSDVREDQREKLLAEFIQEGALLADLSERSAAIVQARDIGMYKTPKGDVVPYMVLEWLEGASLEAVLANENAKSMAPRTLAETVRLLEPAAEALALAHVKGIAHRDIKPANIFVLGDPRGSDSTVKLLDFGIAKVVQDVQKMGGAFSKTSGQITSFTPMYGAPEQFNRSHGATGPWTDVFAFALMMVETLTLKEPLTGDNLMQLAYASADPVRRPTPRTHGAVVTDEVENVFLKAVAVNPQDRHATAGAFWNALRQAMKLEPMRSITARSGGSLIAFGETQVAPEEARTSVDPQKARTAMEADPIAALHTPPARMGIIIVAAGAVSLMGVAIAGYFWLRDDISEPRGTRPTPSASGAASASGTPLGSAASGDAEACPVGMIAIPGGKFYMGSEDNEATAPEKPQHQVTLAPFCIDELEVTTEKYKACSDGGNCPPNADSNEWPGITEKERKTYDPLCNRRDGSAHARHPMNCVDWSMADKFCSSAGARLPTEAEWEFAARGPDGRKYPWGDDPPSSLLLNACGKECVDWGKKNQVEPALLPMYPQSDGFATTAPVGSFPSGKSRYGVYDVVGNVWEWVADYYAPYAAGEATAPQGPAAGSERVIRGGGWNGSDPTWVRPTFRFKAEPGKRSHGTGFRCAKSK